MSVFKPIDKSNISITETSVYKKQSLHSGSNGINSIQYRSGSVIAGSNNLPSTSGSYWESLRVLYYLSGSVAGTGADALRYNQPVSSLVNWSFYDNPQRVNKFFTSGSIISIAQQYFGERIKPTSFVLTDNSHASGTVTIKDDGYGNLYPVDNTISHSTSSPSSSDNYVGNIFYDHGIVTITDTGSYSHTPSTGSITVLTAISHSHNFSISSSDETSIKFQVASGSVPSDTDTVKYFLSGSTTTVTALNATNKINSTFASFVTASVASAVVSLTNDRKPNNPVNLDDNLPPITGSGAGFTFKGFGAGTATVPYTKIGTDKYTLEFSSTQTIYTHEYTITIQPDEFNFTMNPTARVIRSGSDLTDIRLSPWIHPQFTGSKTIDDPWWPATYMNSIQLYSSETQVLGTYGSGRNQITSLMEPVAVAKLPRPIKMRDDMTIIFKIRLDI